MTKRQITAKPKALYYKVFLGIKHLDSRISILYTVILRSSVRSGLYKTFINNKPHKPRLRSELCAQKSKELFLLALDFSRAKK